MLFEDLLELKKKFGLTAAELGIEEKFMFSYKTKGKIFSYDCDCYLNFDSDNKFTDYNLYVYGVKNDDLNKKLNDIYSGPVSKNMTPYVASNGGSIYTTIYEDKDAIISVSIAQKNNYYQVIIKPNPNPVSDVAKKMVPTKTKGTFPENVVVELAEYNNGILTIKVTNHKDDNLELSDDFELFEHKDSSYYGKFKTTFAITPVNNYTILPEKTLDIKLDLRLYGKVTPNEYLVKFSDISLFFTLE